jgi:hypothetical protein
MALKSHKKSYYKQFFSDPLKVLSGNFGRNELLKSTAEPEAGWQERRQGLLPQEGVRPGVDFVNLRFGQILNFLKTS